MTMAAAVLLPPRLLARKEAARYCGVGVDVFDADWRPYLPEVPKKLGANREMLYDVHDLDALIEQRKRPARVDR